MSGNVRVACIFCDVYERDFFVSYYTKSVITKAHVLLGSFFRGKYQFAL